MGRYWKIPLLVTPFLVILFAIVGNRKGDATWLGMKVDDLDKAEAAQMGVPANAGLVVVEAVEYPALTAGVFVGDIVVGINGRKIQSVDEFQRAAQSVMNSRRQDGRLPDVVLTLNRRDKPVVVTVPSEQVEAGIRGLL